MFIIRIKFLDIYCFYIKLRPTNYKRVPGRKKPTPFGRPKAEISFPRKLLNEAVQRLKQQQNATNSSVVSTYNTDGQPVTQADNIHGNYE